MIRYDTIIYVRDTIIKVIDLQIYRMLKEIAFLFGQSTKIIEKQNRKKTTLPGHKFNLVLAMESFFPYVLCQLNQFLIEAFSPNPFRSSWLSNLP